jgi:hypothetical protein
MGLLYRDFRVFGQGYTLLHHSRLIFVCLPVTTSAAVIMHSAGNPSKRNTRLSSGASTLLMLVLLLLAVYRQARIYAPAKGARAQGGKFPGAAY